MRNKQVGRLFSANAISKSSVGLRKWLSVLSLVICICPSTILAKQTGSTVNYTFSGILSSFKPCVINKGLPINVDFGTVYIAKVSAGIYKKKLDYTIECSGASADSVVQMSIKGAPVDAEGTAVATSADGLWVHFLYGDKPIPMNVPQKITGLGTPPVITAQLIKDPSQDLHESPFSAAVTLMAEYM